MTLALVTGSGGFVGTHIASRLLDDGWDVIGVDRYQPPIGDHRLSWDGDVRTWFHNYGATAQPDLIVHCAAVVGGRTMIDGEPLRLAVEDLSLDAEMFKYAEVLRGLSQGRGVYTMEPFEYRKVPDSIAEGIRKEVEAERAAKRK